MTQYITHKKRIQRTQKLKFGLSNKIKDVKKIINENNKLHILVVDDDDRIRSLLKDYLSENNYIVSTAEMLIKPKKLGYLKFDIIILDVMMPGQSGYEFTKDIKKKIEIPIILLTRKVKLKIELKVWR